MRRQSEFFYNRFSFFYPMVDIFLRPQKRVLFEEINALPDGQLLEIGVGNGAHLSLYEKHKVIAIDTSSAMLAIASVRKRENVSLLQMNGEALIFQDACFDYIVLSHIISVVSDPDRLIDEVFRVLKPNGKVFILNHFTPDNWLKYVDRAFGVISKRLHFKSVFHITDFTAINKFSLIKEVRFGSLSYFKLLIYQKK